MAPTLPSLRWMSDRPRGHPKHHRRVARAGYRGAPRSSGKSSQHRIGRVRTARNPGKSKKSEEIWVSLLFGVFSVCLGRNPCLKALNQVPAVSPISYARGEGFEAAGSGHPTNSPPQARLLVSGPRGGVSLLLGVLLCPAPGTWWETPLPQGTRGGAPFPPGTRGGTGQDRTGQVE